MIVIKDSFKRVSDGLFLLSFLSSFIQYPSDFFADPLVVSLEVNVLRPSRNMMICGFVRTHLAKIILIC